MAYREVRVLDCLEVLRRSLARDGIHQIARSTGLDRKTVRRFVGAAAELALKPGAPWPDESVVVAYVNRVKPRPPAAAPGGTEAVLVDQYTILLADTFWAHSMEILWWGAKVATHC
jgi:hypothetical protein